VDGVEPGGVGASVGTEMKRRMTTNRDWVVKTRPVQGVMNAREMGRESAVVAWIRHVAYCRRG
jgi:hypothetical protein